ncbi:MAG: 50S ribosome-binding GTPase [Planctomycetia bacterium]|nr:50S ribosome-binding GTPase [Planctomycetia bacterium]
MSTETMTSHAEPVLRTLAPLLTRLERSVRHWLDAKHLYPRKIVTLATLEGLADDLKRQAEQLKAEQPLLCIMLMGGTGVGKSSLLNALAGGAIAKASFARPTTMDPVVYYHESVKPEKFDPVLRTCHLASHDRMPLQHKIIVDTPDVDSTHLKNRDKLLQLLPVADVVIYVGSSEKYHDSIGHEIFKQQRKRRAFGFVLNKWDRCLHNNTQGLRPDEDWLNDLKNEGFTQPRFFRTVAQHWVDKANGVSENGELPPGEQFLELTEWLEQGLNRLEIDAIKVRGINLTFEQLERALHETAPPDLTDISARTRTSWEKLLDDEAHASADVLLNTLEPYQREIEHHFTVECYRRFRGLMSGYLTLITKIKYAGTSLRDHLPFLPRPSAAVETKSTWDVNQFTRACTSVAGERQLDARTRALSHRLLVEADKNGFPLELLNEPTENASKIDWRQRYADALMEVLQHVEQQWSKPTGPRRWINGVITIMANVMPPLVLFASYGLVLWNVFQLPGSGNMELSLQTVLLVPLAITLIFLVMLHLLIAVVLPLRWNRIRGEFHRELEERLNNALSTTFASIPKDRADALLEERRDVEKLVAEVREVAAWLEQRQQAANIGVLYGN